LNITDPINNKIIEPPDRIGTGTPGFGNLMRYWVSTNISLLWSEEKYQIY